MLSMIGRRRHACCFTVAPARRSASSREAGIPHAAASRSGRGCPGSFRLRCDHGAPPWRRRDASSSTTREWWLHARPRTGGRVPRAVSLAAPRPFRGRNPQSTRSRARSRPRPGQCTSAAGPGGGSARGMVESGANPEHPDLTARRSLRAYLHYDLTAGSALCRRAVPRTEPWRPGASFAPWRRCSSRNI